MDRVILLDFGGPVSTNSFGSIGEFNIDDALAKTALSVNSAIESRYLIENLLNKMDTILNVANWRLPLNYTYISPLVRPELYKKPQSAKYSLAEGMGVNFVVVINIMESPTLDEDSILIGYKNEADVHCEPLEVILRKNLLEGNTLVEVRNFGSHSDNHFLSELINDVSALTVKTISLNFLLGKEGHFLEMLEAGSFNALLLQTLLEYFAVVSEETDEI